MADCAAKSALSLSRVKAGVPDADLKKSTSIFFLPCKMIGMVRSQTNFILSSLSCEIGHPLTSGAGRMKLSCLMPTSVTHICSFHTS